MAAVPEATPVTTPVEPTVAMLVLLLLQEPPDVLLLKVVDKPAHSTAEPVIAERLETVTVRVA